MEHRDCGVAALLRLQLARDGLLRLAHFLHSRRHAIRVRARDSCRHRCRSSRRRGKRNSCGA
jgi:hypothetical protein